MKTKGNFVTKDLVSFQEELNINSANVVVNNMGSFL